jgi:hypothetical protein
VYREKFERQCPTCSEWISATAPKCFNCGERVDGDEDEDDEVGAGNPNEYGRRIVAVVGGLLVVGFLVWLLRGGFAWDAPRSAPPADVEAQADQLQQMMARQIGRESFNASSPMTWAEVEPQLRLGMSREELTRVVTAKDSPAGRTTFANIPTDDATATASQMILLRDATLIVRLDAVGSLQSWTTRPVP